MENIPEWNRNLNFHYMHIPFYLFYLIRKFVQWSFSRTFIFWRWCTLSTLLTVVPNSVTLCSIFRIRQATPWTVCKLVNNSSNLRRTSLFQPGKNVKDVLLIFEVHFQLKDICYNPVPIFRSFEFILPSFSGVLLCLSSLWLYTVRLSLCLTN
jgi:hypothetical protein